MQSDEKEEWKAAIAAEINMLKKMETWKMEDLPEGREAIGCCWDFNKK
jgi:hypothetical protein